jgi:hypothetical protein
MKLRVIAGVLLLLVAVGLPLAAMSSDGPPWGFRGHQAVVVEYVGTVEATASAARMQKSRAVDDKLEVGVNARFDVGDEFRVARLSQLRLRFAGADIVAGDGARLMIGTAGIRLVRGVVDIALRDGGRSFVVDLDTGGAMTVRGTGAMARVLADGKGGAQAWVDNGSLEGRAARGEVLAEPGRLLVVRGDEATLAEKSSAVEVTATCTAGKLNVVAPAQTQVFAAGTLAYPDVASDAGTGSLVIEIEPGIGEVQIVARDVFSQSGRTTASCEKRK